MKSLLTALDEGRLVELPDPIKDKSLENLALLLEAIPGTAARAAIVEEIQKREAAGTTAIGKGIACPHARKEGEGDLLCAIGWSPQGIDYGATDGEKVHLVVMYYIPDSQKNYYLKEISSLAKAVVNTGGITTIINAQDIHTVRNQLLDWVSIAIDAAMPEPKARMIKLQEKQAAILAAGGEKLRTPFTVVPFSVLLAAAARPIVLSKDPDFVRSAESLADLPDLLKKNEAFELSGYQVIVRAVSNFVPDRSFHECLAIKFEDKR